MDNEQVREQPEAEEQVQSYCQCGTSTSSEEGSLGKFKDAQSLLEAYNNLQAEFTKKCQKLNSILKTDETEVYLKENWNSKVSEFLEKYTNAKAFSTEISEYILNNPELKNNPNALEIAWAKISTEKFKSPEELVSDKTFLQSYILNSEDVKKQVLDEILKDIKPAPTVIGSDGYFSSGKSTEGPKSLNEAKLLVEQIFKN